jgi:hypothetical protein
MLWRTGKHLLKVVTELSLVLVSLNNNGPGTTARIFVLLLRASFFGYVGQVNHLQYRICRACLIRLLEKIACSVLPI